MNPQEFPYCKKIEDELYRGIVKGLSVPKIFDKMRHWQNCPANVTTIYRKYSEVISKAKVDYDEKILGYADKRMEEGSDKLIELALRSKVGWNPTTKVQEVDADDPDDQADALSVLLEKLGKVKPDATDG